MKRSTMVAIAAILPMLLFAVSANYSYSSAQTNPSPTWALNPQQTTLTATFSSVPPATLALSAAEVNDMIEKLAEMRAAMKPPRPAGNPAPGTKINVATAGNWYVQADGTGIDLVVFHPGYGWVRSLHGPELDRATQSAPGPGGPPGAGTGTTSSGTQMRHLVPLTTSGWAAPNHGPPPSACRRCAARIRGHSSILCGAKAAGGALSCGRRPKSSPRPFPRS